MSNHSNDLTKIRQRSFIVTLIQTHISYPVVESRRPVWAFREVVDSIVAGMTWIQEQTHIFYVVLYSWLHPFCWEGHDYKHTQTNAEKCVTITLNVSFFLKKLNSNLDTMSHRFHLSDAWMRLLLISFSTCNRIMTKSCSNQIIKNNCISSEFYEVMCLPAILEVMYEISRSPLA